METRPAVTPVYLGYLVTVILALAQDLDKTARGPWGSLGEVKGCVHLFLEYTLD